jgi:hypothetical protein
MLSSFYVRNFTASVKIFFCGLSISLCFTFARLSSNSSKITYAIENVGLESTAINYFAFSCQPGVARAKPDSTQWPIKDYKSNL